MKRRRRAKTELSFSPRDAGDTLNDTVRYLRENFRVGK